MNQNNTSMKSYNYSRSAYLEHWFILATWGPVKIVGSRINMLWVSKFGDVAETQTGEHHYSGVSMALGRTLISDRDLSEISLQC